jgi:hypothetical protein
MLQRGAPLASTTAHELLQRRGAKPSTPTSPAADIVLDTTSTATIRKGLWRMYPFESAGFIEEAMWDLCASFRCDDATIHTIVREAVDVECEYVECSLPVDLIGMNAGLMKQYVRFVADRLVTALGAEPLYGDTNPFDWMELISLQGKTNFFERRVGEYQKANVMAREDRSLVTDADF